MATATLDAPLVSEETVRLFLEAQGYEILGPVLPRDHPDYEPPPDDDWTNVGVQIVGVQLLVGFYYVKEAS